MIKLGHLSVTSFQPQHDSSLKPSYLAQEPSADEGAELRPEDGERQSVAEGRGLGGPAGTNR